MRRMIVVLLSALYIVGCSGLTSEKSVETPLEEESPLESPALQDVFPGVPRHPEAGGHELAIPQRAIIRVPDKPAAEVLSWYRSNLSTQGWKVVPTVLQPDVLLISKDRQYLSLSSHDAPGGSAVVWLHLRSTPEVTADEAKAIASATDNSPVQWIATYMAEFESDVHTGGTGHPVWTVKGQRDGMVRVVVNVDAITAEPFQINTID